MDSTDDSEISSPVQAQRFGRVWPPWLGGLFQVGGLAGSVISVLALLAGLIISPGLLRNLRRTVTSAAEQIRSAEEAIDLVSETLTNSGVALSDLSDLLSNSDLFVGDTVEVLDTVGSAIGEDASMTIRATHRAVVAAQGGARAIDSTLSALSVVEFLTGVSYDPEQSLSASLEDVAASLDDLPETLTGVQESMEDSAESLDQLRPRIMRVSGDLESLSENVFSAVDLVESQRVTVRRVAGNVQSLDRELAKWFWVPVATLFIGALGLGILFLGLYVLGSELRTSAEK